MAIDPTTVHPRTERLYDRLGPAFHTGDEDSGWLQLSYIDALATPGKPVDDLVRDTDTAAGWQLAIDPDTTPAPDWAAQFYGQQRLPGESTEALRARMRDRPNFRRGRPATIKAAIAATVPAGTPVTIVERLGGNAYRYLVHVWAASVPDPAATQAAFVGSRPGGFINSVLVISPAATWADIDSAAGSWSGLDGEFASWAALDAYTP